MHEFSAAALVAAYRERRLSPVEVAEAALARIAERDGAVNAFCLVDGDLALAQARDSEARWAAGEPAGLVDGVPVAIKDILLTRGRPTLRGSRTIDPAGPWEDDAPTVAALRRHGAVFPGKTTTPEFGWKGVTDSPLTGITRNPWDPSRTAGGSSGGSSAALAAGMVPLALGTDGGGSIRIPCGFCGLPGIKPTYGLVPAFPASPFGAVAHVGPMARTVEDLALALDVIGRPDPRDWQALPAQGSFRAGLDDGVGGLRIAFSPDLGYARVDGEVAALVERAASAFASLGARVERADPGFPDPREIYDTLWSAGAGKVVAGLADTSEVDPGLLAIAAAGQAIPLGDYLAALAARDELAIGLSRFLDEWDLLLTPALPIPAFAAGRNTPDDPADPGWPGWTPFTYPFNLSQQPAAVVPCGFTEAGLPVGLQLVGARHADALVLRACRAYEQAWPQPTVAP